MHKLRKAALDVSLELRWMWCWMWCWNCRTAASEETNLALEGRGGSRVLKCEPPRSTGKAGLLEPQEVHGGVAARTPACWRSQAVRQIPGSALRYEVLSMMEYRFEVQSMVEYCLRYYPWWMGYRSEVLPIAMYCTRYNSW